MATVVYQMEMDVEVDFDSVEVSRRRFRRSQSASDAFGERVSEAGDEAIHAVGGKFLVGSGVSRPDGNAWFSNTFEAPPGATAALEVWLRRVMDLTGTRRVLSARLRGEDGTDYSYEDEEYARELQEQLDRLPPDTREDIARLVEGQEDL